MGIDMVEPAVSVLMPVRDAGPWLEGCLRSLKRQTLGLFEVVAVDDGSVDGSGELLDRWARDDGRFRVLHRRAEGLVGALNAGLAWCRADVIARMDADDAAHPRRLESQMALLDQRPEIGVVSCGVRHVPVSRVQAGLLRYEEWLNGLLEHDSIMRERFVESPVAHPSAVVRRNALRNAGGWRDMGWPEDYDLWLRLAEKEILFAKVPEVLYFWRDHEERLTRTDPRYSKDAFLRVKARFLARGPLAGGRDAVVWGAGSTGRRLGRHLEEEGAGIRAFVDIDPRLEGRRRRGVPVVSPEDLADFLDPGVVVLTAVASWGARELIRSRLLTLGLVEGDDFWCCA